MVDMWYRHRPVFVLALSVCAVVGAIVIFTTTILGLIDAWEWDTDRGIAVILNVFAIGVIVLVAGYAVYPYAIVTIISGGSEGAEDDGQKQQPCIEIWCDGRKIPVAKLPVQFKVYFRRVGEYNVYLLQDSKIITPEKDWGTISFYQSHIPHTKLSI